MQITDITGKDVILSKSSITVKGENGKTCGVVRGLTKWHDIQANRQFELRKKLGGVWGVNRLGIKMDRVYFDSDYTPYLIVTPIDRFVLEDERIKAKELRDAVEMQIIEVSHLNIKS